MAYLVSLFVILLSFLASAQYNVWRRGSNERLRMNLVRNMRNNHMANNNQAWPIVRQSNQQRISEAVDCFGLGSTVALALERWFAINGENPNEQNARFFLTSRRQPNRVEVVTGEQFGLEWTDFKIERRTVFIVHGFLSQGNESWVKLMEEAFLLWGDVNVVVVDWALRANTFNYFSAVVNTRTIGNEIARFLHHIVNATVAANSPHTPKWGTLHLVGHSLGAHICGFAAKELKRRQNKWAVSRITGLDPAHPCFNNVTGSLRLSRNDAPFVDVIHTNGRQEAPFAFGLPHAIGHADFYPSGGKTQTGCERLQGSFFDFLPIPKPKLEQAVCSHGRSYLYLIESLFSAVSGNCTFWAHHWDRTYRRAIQLLSESCGMNTCSEMGIRAENHPQRGTFFVITSRTAPFCAMDTGDTEEIKRQLRMDYIDEIQD